MTPRSREISRASAIDPIARSIVVIGNGGGALWDALKSHAARNPGWWNRENPLDDFTREVVERDLAAPLRASGLRCTTVYPFMSNGRTLSFIELGKVAGIAGPSILGVTVHPVYGPWIAFRAALLLDEELDSPGDALGFDPCPTCTARTCIPACPANAVSVESGWDIPTLPDASRGSRAGLHPAMPRARRMRPRPRASLSRRGTRLSSDARAPLDAPVLRNAHQTHSPNLIIPI